MLLRQGPIFMQLGSMLCSPLPDEPLTVGRKLALHQSAVKGKGRTTPFMTRMKMRWQMIVIKHLHPDSEKPAYLWHDQMFS